MSIASHANGLCFLHSRIEEFVDKISDANFVRRPAESLNPPVWILGHILTSLDGMAKLAGEEYHLPMSWHNNFKPGSVPFQNETPYPSKSEMLEQLKIVVDRTIQLTESLDDKTLAEDNSIEFFQSTPIRSKEDLLGLLMTAHVGWHLGHLDWTAKLLASP